MANPTAITLSSMIQSVRERCDMVNSQFVTDNELTGYINASIAELRGLLIQKYGDNYFAAPPVTFQTDGTSQRYDLPDDLFKLMGVDLNLSSSPDGYVTLRKAMFRDRNKWAVPNTQTFYGPINLRYDLVGNQVMFFPIPQGGQTVRLWYVPKIVYLVNPSDTIDGYNGWEEYVIVDTCIKTLLKEESTETAQMFGMQKASIVARIESEAENRDQGSPPTVIDTQRNSVWGGFGNGYDNDGMY